MMMPMRMNLQSAMNIAMRKAVCNQVQQRTFIFCKKSECAKAETGNCICKNMREAKEKAQAGTKKVMGKVGKLLGVKSWFGPLKALERGHSGKWKRDPLGLFDGSTEEQQAKKARQVFAALDKDGSGSLSAEELRAGLKEVGIEATQEQVKKMISEADENGDHFIQVEEFLKVVQEFRKEVQVVPTAAQYLAQVKARNMMQ